MNWMKVAMTVDDIKFCKHMSLQDEFEKAFMLTMAPQDAAMFQNDSSFGEYGYYFSPGAAAIFSVQLEIWNAIKCESPPSEETSLLVGHSDARDILLEKKVTAD